MSKEISIVLVGVCGFGRGYVNWLRPLYERFNVKLAGVVDIRYEDSEFYQEFQNNNTPCFHSMEEFYENSRADLAIIATPIQFHKEHMIFAMKNGSHVLCEKPVAAQYADVEEVKRAAGTYKKFVGIGFQWSYQTANLKFKEDVASGLWGKPLQLKTIVLWPRATTYYTGRGWAGKKYTKDGKLVMDSIASNATSHYLHNMLFVLGDKPSTTARVKLVDFVLYRANDIETFDACQAQVTTEEGVPLLYYVAHCVEKILNPTLEFTFENGVIRYSPETENQLVGQLKSGEKIEYGTLSQPEMGLIAMLNAIANNDPSYITCTVDTASAHMQIMDQLNARLEDACVFDKKDISVAEQDGGVIVAAKGIREKLLRNYEKGIIEK